MSRRRNGGGRRCTSCGLPCYRTHAQAAAAASRKGCHIRGVYRCGTWFHFDATVLLEGR